MTRMREIYVDRAVDVSVDRISIVRGADIEKSIFRIHNYPFDAESKFVCIAKCIMSNRTSDIGLSHFFLQKLNRF